MRPAQLLATVFALSSLSAAWPWPDETNYKGVGDFILLGRQNNADNGNNKNNGGNNNNPNNGGHHTTTKPKNSKSSASKTDSSKTSKETGTDKGDGSKTTDKATTTKSKSYGITVRPGTVSLRTPAISSGPQYYAIGDYVTFGWNYTNLKATPAHIDVLASCTLNQKMYTIAANISAEKSGLAVWDTKEDATGTEPLPMASYTLYIKDSDMDISATAEPGYLSVYNQYNFAMYIPQKYTPLADYECATCDVKNAGIASVPAHQTLTLILGMASVTVLSFTWFASNRFGVF